MQMATVKWFIKCGLTAAVLLLACGFGTARFGHGLQLPSTATRDGSLITLNRYAKEPIPDVVLVGSSLTFRLKEEYFATTNLRNLALAGGSPVTALEIVANQPRLPRIVLVETNVLSRATALPTERRAYEPDGVCGDNLTRYWPDECAQVCFFRMGRALLANQRWTSPEHTQCHRPDA